MTPTRTEAIDLIRTFDEWQYDQTSGDYIKTIDGGTVRKRDDEFRYDTDIDWIYPVCKKFAQIDYRKTLPSIEWGRFNCIYKYNIEKAVSSYDILNIFNALVPAIQWYNTIKDK